MNSSEKEILRTYLLNKRNVMFTGKHGVGKTAIIKELFEESYGKQNIDWIYLSASTIDPWVDLIGIPHEVTDPDGLKYLDFIRPKALAMGQLKAIFIDEYNRAHKKVHNALMELVQFKSINGFQFEKLELVWAACNPKESDQDENEAVYAVEVLDPAQEDRFHVHWDIPYDVCDEYFIAKYGEKTGTGACQFWRELSNKQQAKVSPRRLDYALEAIRDKLKVNGTIIPKGISINRLTTLIKQGSPSLVLRELAENGYPEKDVRQFFASPDNFNSVFKDITKDEKIATAVLNYMPEEHAIAMIGAETSIQNLVFRKAPELFENLLNVIANGSGSAAVKNNAQEALRNIEQKKAKAPKDIASLVQDKTYSDNLKNKVDNCTDLSKIAIDVEKIENESALTIVANKKISTTLLASIKEAVEILDNNNAGTIEKQKAMGNVSNALGNVTCPTLVDALLSLADSFCNRSQVEKIVSSGALTNMVSFCIESLVKEGFDSDTILSKLTEYKYLAYKMLSIVATQGVLASDPDITAGLCGDLLKVIPK